MTAYHGVYDSTGTDATDVADGYGKILADLITASEVTPIAIGALDSVNAYDQLHTLWRSIPEKYRTSSRMNWIAYMSEDSYNAYEDCLDSKNWNTGRGDEYVGPKTLRKSGGALKLCKASWMSTSDRVIMTPKSNILLAADATQQDLARMNIVQDVWFAKVGIAAALGFNFRYAPLIFCNEVA